MSRLATRPFTTSLVGLAATWLHCALVLTASAQNAYAPGPPEPATLGVSELELEAYTHADAGRYIRAREIAERIVARDPYSFAGHFVLGLVQHFGEANLPRALYHLELARKLFEGRHGDAPTPDTPWRWHAGLLKELSTVRGDMEEHVQKLTLIARYNKLYEPDLIAERAWPLLKLARFDEARLSAELGLTSGRPGQRVVALNALCAIEFEAGNDDKSYDACKRAVADSEAQSGLVSAVDLTNFAEASRSLFKLDEAERVALQATTALPSWYGNPWMELGELYVRQGRFGEALAALRKMPEYRMQRPPHVRDADRGETRRVLAGFLLVMGKAQDAADVTGRAIAAPDRRAHNSRDPAQDEIVLALLDRAAHETVAELELERAATLPWYERPLAWLASLRARFAARRSAARIDKLQASDERLSGLFRIGQATSAIMPPWLVGDLVSTLGAGVVGAGNEHARHLDKRKGASPYYEAIEAEVLWAQGQDIEAVRTAERSLSGLGPGEVLLAARAHAIAADASRRAGQLKRAELHYDGAFQRDPGVLRRLGLPVAVHVRTSGALGGELADVLEAMPRFVSSPQGLLLEVTADRASARACLRSSRGQALSCGEVDGKTAPPDQGFVAYAALELARQLFSPRIDLSQTDIHSLDGQNLSGRDALRSVFD